MVQWPIKSYSMLENWDNSVHRLNEHHSLLYDFSYKQGSIEQHKIQE